MQPTTLNKIVSLFLVGGLIILGLAFVLLSNGWKVVLPGELQSLFVGGGAGFYAVVGGLLLLPLVALLGVVCEALTDILIRSFVSWAFDRRIVVGFFLQGRALDDYNFWLEKFKVVVQSSPALNNFTVAPNFKGTAVGLLYDSRQGEAISWAESHYATYVLATNFALLAVAAEIYICVAGSLSPLNGLSSAWVTVALAGVFYSCMSLSFDRYLYSYQISLRQAAIILIGGISKEEAAEGGGWRKNKPHNLVLHRMPTALCAIAPCELPSITRHAALVRACFPMFPRFQDEGRKGVGCIHRKTRMSRVQFVALPAWGMSRAGMCSQGSNACYGTDDAAKDLLQILVFYKAWVEAKIFTNYSPNILKVLLARHLQVFILDIGLAYSFENIAGGGDGFSGPTLDRLKGSIELLGNRRHVSALNDFLQRTRGQSCSHEDSSARHVVEASTSENFLKGLFPLKVNLVCWFVFPDRRLHVRLDQATQYLKWICHLSIHPSEPILSLELFATIWRVSWSSRMHKESIEGGMSLALRQNLAQRRYHIGRNMLLHRLILAIVLLEAREYHGELTSSWPSTLPSWISKQ